MNTITNDMYETFDKTPLPYWEVCHFHTRDYLESKNSAKYFWNYGDSVRLKFDIDSEYSDATIKATLYNFRGEPIYSISGAVVETNFFYISIDSVLSTNYFTKGTYSCKLQALRVINNSEDTYDVTTLIPAEACTLYVR